MAMKLVVGGNTQVRKSTFAPFPFGKRENITGQSSQAFTSTKADNVREIPLIKILPKYFPFVVTYDF